MLSYKLYRGCIMFWVWLFLCSSLLCFCHFLLCLSLPASCVLVFLSVVRLFLCSVFIFFKLPSCVFVSFTSWFVLERPVSLSSFVSCSVLLVPCVSPVLQLPCPLYITVGSFCRIPVACCALSNVFQFLILLVLFVDLCCTFAFF